MRSMLEVCGHIKFTALSSHYDYLAVINCSENEDVLFIIHLKEKRVESVKTFLHPTTALYFAPEVEYSLFVASSSGHIFYIDIFHNGFKVLEGHKSPPRKISQCSSTDLLLTWSSSEVCLWESPQYLLSKRLNIDSGHAVIEAGFIWQKQYIFAAFSSGVVMVWEQSNNMKEIVIEPPDGILMEFSSFSLSCDGEWLIGVGSQALIVVYSISSQRVAQVTQYTHSDLFLGFNYVHFLPYILPQYPKTFLLSTSNSVVIVDFTNSTVIKVLKSHHHSVRHVSVSGDGFLLGIVYGNGCAKLYTLASFYPKPSNTLKTLDEKLKDDVNTEVDFVVMKTEDHKEKKEEIAKLFDETKWRQILEEYEAFPSAYRKHIWTSLAKLPKNFSIVNEILLKEKSFDFKELEQAFPGVRGSVLEVLRSTLECLCFWAPPLANVEFLPQFILPFVQLFEPNILLCFEISVFVILNYFQFCSKNSAPSKVILKLLDDIVKSEDVRLWSHLQKINVSASQFAWPLLTSAFRQILTNDDWLILWDHILAEDASFMFCVCASFTLCLRKTLLQCAQRSQAEQLFYQETWISIRSLIKKAKKVKNSLKIDDDVKKKLETKHFLPKGALLPFRIEAEFENDEQVKHLTTSMQNKSGRSLEFQSKEEFRASAKSKLLPSLNDGKVSGEHSTSLSDKEIPPVNSEKFTEMEDTCLRNIRSTRKKLINRLT